jgi:tRNA 2-selenouridine synthase
MPVQTIDIHEFVRLGQFTPVLDVRSPGEFVHAHIPSAVNVPLFSDEERKIIGTAYKQESREIAVNHGLQYFSERMKTIPGEVQIIIDKWKANSENYSPVSDGLLVNCWRGGMRSGTVAWLLNLYGYKVYVLEGGYKAFRNFVLQQFEKTYSLRILGGYTGSGKTEVLKEMKRRGQQVIDLEELASHKGSAFGALGEKSQPGQEMFENLLAMELWKYGDIKQGDNGNAQTKCIWLEDESPNIGKITIPRSLWTQMRSNPLFFLAIPFERRLENIVTNYGKFNADALAEAISKLNRHLGGAATSEALQHLKEQRIEECFRILIHYYDKAYTKSLHKRDNLPAILHTLQCEGVCSSNSDKILNEMENTSAKLPLAAKNN